MNKTDNISLLRGDCLEILPAIADKSVDAVICDLPYSITNCKWDKEIPLIILWQQLLRCTKRNAAIVFFGQGMFTAKLMMSMPDIWRYNLVWKKGTAGTGHLNASRMPLRNHEDICVFYRYLPTYNPQMVFGKPFDKTKYNGSHKRESVYNGYTMKVAINKGTRYPLSVLDIKRDWKRQDQFHPTQKPVALLEYLIRTYTNEGDCVLDCTMGSGSTMVACANTGRRGIGIELMQEYYDIAVKRVKDAQAQLKLDLVI